jgi:hypothetical protein
MEPFLKATEIVDWHNPQVRSKALKLASGASGDLEIARRCFEWVRDNIQHSSDYKRNPVTCAASDVSMTKARRIHSTVLTPFIFLNSAGIEWIAGGTNPEWTRSFARLRSASRFA